MSGLALSDFVAFFVLPKYTEGIMENTNSLKTVEEKLTSSGMKDVKFLFKREAMAIPLSNLEADLADVLNKFLAGKTVKADCLPSEELTRH